MAAVVGGGLAILLTLGTMNAYVASLAALGATLPRARGLPGGPLTPPNLIALGALLVTSGRQDAETLLVGVTAASQVPVLVLALAAGARLLPRGPEPRRALSATLATSALLVPAGHYLIAPAVILAGVLASKYGTGWLRRRRELRDRPLALLVAAKHAPDPRTTPSKVPRRRR